MDGNSMNAIVIAVNLVIIMYVFFTVAKEGLEDKKTIVINEPTIDITPSNPDGTTMETADTTPDGDKDTGPNTSPEVATATSATNVVVEDKMCYSCKASDCGTGYRYKGIKEVCPAPNGAAAVIKACCDKIVDTVAPKKTIAVPYKSTMPSWLTESQRDRLAGASANIPPSTQCPPSCCPC